MVMASCANCFSEGRRIGCAAQEQDHEDIDYRSFNFRRGNERIGVGAIAPISE
jgi:hypothetical protein